MDKRLSEKALGGQPFDHKANHRGVDQGFGGLGQKLIAAVESAVEAEPGQGAFYRPRVAALPLSVEATPPSA